MPASYTPSSPPSELMSIDQYRTAMNAYRRDLLQWVALATAPMLVLALLCIVAPIAFPGVLDKLIREGALIGIAILVLASITVYPLVCYYVGFSKKTRLTEQRGLRCPNCRGDLVGGLSFFHGGTVYSPGVIQTRNCPHCGRQALAADG